VQLRFFTIPVHGPEDGADDLNRFLAEQRVLGIDRQLVVDGANSVWTICVTFEQSGARPSTAKRGKVDFKDVLSPPEFAVFARLRALRKTMADGEGVPAYALFTNDQLAAMVQRRVNSATALREIPGVGESRVEKYGKAFLEVLKQASLPVAAVEESADET
jgi:superfamily II DNA helicase RecQ